MNIKIAVFGCTHVPLNDREFEDEFLLPQLEKFQPEIVVHAGDLFEAQHASRWPTPAKYDWTIDDELEQGGRYLDRIDKVTPTASKVIVMGNHDENFITHSRVPQMYGKAMDWRHQIKSHWKRGTESYVNDHELGVWRWGQVVVAHGYSAGRNADEDMAVALALPYGAHHLYVGAHTHRPVPLRRARLRSHTLPLHYTNPGCGRSLKPDYVKRLNTAEWGQGITLIEARDWRYMGGFVPTATEWDCETLVYQYGHGYAPESADMMELKVR